MQPLKQFLIREPDEVSEVSRNKLICVRHLERELGARR